ncbi:ergot alkaloid biosynthesis protein [Melittangium boletus]|uniref:NAD(P)-dependent oxidoreductase n=1 Tax=Melittangium boletus DSM 14713 TaxID=1294270 RepID=A0A250INW7_9BACT|nr:ergot alkaloid biosynthesis protein [Melittangium boletus]ATB33434.1 NAD(P)-dependent oxidoreductase [Melittangium boletus DSM 14713]
MSGRGILVTGGTGKTGGRIVRRLRELGRDVRVASRSGAAPEGVPGVRFDWNDPASHASALEGVERIYLVAPVLVSEPYPLMSAFIERAMESGVRRFVLLSASSLPEGGPAMGRVHQLLRERAPEWAVLRPSWFMQNFTEGAHRDSIRDEGVLYSATGEGRVPFIDADDIAEVGVRALVDDPSHDAAHLLTGPRALSYGEAAEAIGAVLGRPIRHVSLSRQALTERLMARGMAHDYASLLAGMDEAIERGAEDRTTSAVELVTGRPARSFADFARASVAVWRR